MQIALDVYAKEYPREVAEYRAATKGHNYHHTAKRCLVEIDRLECVCTAVVSDLGGIDSMVLI